VDLRSFLRPWSGFVFRHLPAASPYDVLDFRFAGQARDNRWNAQGEPTLYLASDRAVALAEFARHLREDRGLANPALVVERQVFRLNVSLPRTLDLRDPALCDALSLREAPYCFLDKAIARAVAGYLRRTSPVQALLVPSVAFLDDPQRFVLALFLEKLPAEPQEFILRRRAEGTFRVGSDEGG
jgi:RES domain-containing protein